MIGHTMDPDVLIEKESPGYVLYHNIRSGKRWEVHGICDGRRDCMVGAVVDGVLIETVEQARALPTPKLDCPVAPGFTGCCPLRIIELPDGPVIHADRQ